MSMFAGYLMLTRTESSAYAAHAPIVIAGDAEFTPDNGVTQGTGTAADPFVIEGYEIDAVGGNGIEIIGTTSHFVITGCEVQGAVNAIYLNQVSTGQVELCTVYDSEYGISAYMSTDVVVEDNTVDAAYGCIGFGYCTGCRAQWNACTLTDEGSSIGTYECENVFVEHNDIMGDRGYGVDIYSSRSVVVQQNSITGSGCLVRESTGCHLWSNAMLLSGVVLGGTEVGHFDSHDIPTNNSANSRPIYYLKNLIGGTFSEPVVGSLILANCSGLTVQNLVISDIEHAWEPWWFAGGLECYFTHDVDIVSSNFQNCSQSVLVFRSESLTIRDCTFLDSSTAMYLSESQFVTVEACEITHTDPAQGLGITVSECNNTSVLWTNISNCGLGVGAGNSIGVDIENCTMTISGQSAISSGSYEGVMADLRVVNCTISGAIWGGLETMFTDGVMLLNSTITGCGRAIESYASTNLTIQNNSLVGNTESGPFFWASSNILISGNDILGNTMRGIFISGGTNTSITLNTIASSEYGAYCEFSFDTHVYHNDFIENIISAYTYDGTGNVWDDGYPSGGNYWSDYLGVDEYNGPSQDILGGDGIGDTPQSIPGDALLSDRYPLMAPFVGAPNLRPEARFTVNPVSGNITTNFTFDATGSSDAEDPSSGLFVRWDIGNDGSWDFDWSADKVINWKFSTPGIQLIRMQVRDSDWLMNDTTVSIDIVDEAPVAAFTVTPASGATTTTFTFDSSVSQDLENGSAFLDVRWDWESDGTWDDIWTALKVFTRVFLVPGTYNVKLEVRDDAGLTNSTTKQVIVTLDEVAPIADAGEDKSIGIGESVKFDGSGSTDNIGIVNYTWSLMLDGNFRQLYGISPTQKFVNSGEYEVTLVVRDAAGLSGSDTVVITVNGDGGGSVLADYWWVGVMAGVIVVAIAAVLLLRRRAEPPA